MLALLTASSPPPTADGPETIRESAADTLGLEKRFPFFHPKASNKLTYKQATSQAPSGRRRKQWIAQHHDPETDDYFDLTWWFRKGDSNPDRVKELSDLTAFQLERGKCTQIFS